MAALLGITWDELTDHLIQDGVWDRWGELEPALAGVRDVEALRALVGSRRREDFDARDRLLAALLRLGGTEGHDDRRAAQLVWLLMAPGCARLAAQLLHRGVAECDEAVASALWLHVRTAPVSRWERRCAGNLMWAVRKTVEAEYRLATRAGGDVLDLHTVPLEEELEPAVRDQQKVGPTHRAERDLVELLAWAQETRVLSADAVRLLVDLVAEAVTATETGRPGWRAGAELRVVAERRGIPRRTLSRRRAEAIQALRRACAEQAGAVG